MEYYPEVLSTEKSDGIVERAEKHIEEHGFGLLAVELKQSCEFVGFVGLQKVPFDSHFTPAVEIGWRIASANWNRGYATEAARAILDQGFREFGLNEIVAMTYVHNLKSRRVMEKIGMHHDPQDDFLNPHPLLRDTWLAPHVLYRGIDSSRIAS